MLNKKIAVVGAGKIGETIIRALIHSRLVRPSSVTATTRHEETLRARKNLGVRLTLDNAAAVKRSDIVIVSVKPPAIGEALAEMRPSLTPRHLVISTVASVTTRAIEDVLAMRVPVVRTMPNTPCLVRAGMTVLTPGRYAKRSSLSLAREIFDSIGKTMVLDEKHMDAVTGLSGSGPAFMYVVLEALAEGGVKVGLPRETATELIAQTMLGAGRLILETREHPAKLKDWVLTPAGCTIEGLLEMEEGGVRVALIKTVARAARRASELHSG